MKYEGTLLDLVAEGVAAGGVAVVSGDVEVSYAELEVLSNQAARRLGSLGVGVESVVGVRLERGVELVVALLGILKAGGAYLPLDPGYPAERLRFMVEDSGAEVVVSPGMLMDLDEPGTPVDVVVRGENAAYVIYTSGSTGRPKGVVVEHRGIVNRLRWMQAEYGLTPVDRVLQKTPFGFDVSVWEFFWTLSVGATLVMARPGGHRDPAYLTEVLVEEEITTAHFVPSMLRAFLAQPVPRLPLRRVLCSGEALPDELAERFHRKVGCELHNLYGPTEASVDVTAIECLPGVPVTIGRAIANTRIHLVDGELTIAGVQLARGYLNRPSLTAERFVPNPFAVTPGERLYHTGDLARRCGNGTIEYLGRIDHQVKIHGNRIELGEIEAALHSHPALTAAVVAVHEDRLVGYFVAAPGQAPALADLRAWLARTLPDPMLPTVWIALAALPLTPSGKTDRTALPAPDGARPALDVAYAEPRDDTETVIAQIWADTLGVSPVGIHDPFLELGGRSLAATQICARVSRALGRRLSPADLFTAPTVARLAVLAADAVLTVRTVHTGRSVSPAQQRMWFLDQLSGPSAMYTMYEAYRCEGELDADALRDALTDVVRRHETLRTTFRSRRGEPELVVADEPGVPLTVVDGPAEEFVDAEVLRPFDLARGPLLRLALIRGEPGRCTLLAVIHHIIADDTSMEILWRDLAECYRARRAGERPDLPELTVPYNALTAGQETSAEGLAYWKSALDGAPRVLELPGDLARPARQGQLDASVEFSLPRPVTDALDAIATGAGATGFMALLAAFAFELRRSTGRDDLVIGTFTGNRSSLEAEDLVGLFVNTLALRVRAPGDPTYGELLGSVRKAVLDGFRHQDVPFDRLVTALRTPRDLSRNPVAQVAFQLLGALADRLRLDGVRTEPWRAGQGGNPFDVLVTVREHLGGLTGTVHYDRDLFTEGAAKTFTDRFVQVLHTVAADPAARCSTLPR
ncbi:amino acid adenylation domain-containing protein [Amycolatopsis sp. H20-H5]|uniref:amino acid adenylation domain-containing protein n=1 Tax=Amycolatopsis sp. H20-H5 TaxID=3046309 RepID=UPI002DBA82B8|nr:amino acid adenylation domain-containing protein [Amycolatopsis sp. H20-H5]MEC3979514.1 amino acid adenylation domain-containing protein [Amycolatopsis sp. H20-H5]